MTDQPVKIVFAWGWWDRRGRWHHNPWVAVSREDQLAHNLRHGFAGEYSPNADREAQLQRLIDSIRPERPDWRFTPMRKLSMTLYAIGGIAIGVAFTESSATAALIGIAMLAGGVAAALADLCGFGLQPEDGDA